MEDKNNEKLNQILSLLDEGYSATEIADQLGYKRSDQVSQYLRRSGYRWDNNKKKFLKENPDKKETGNQEKREEVKPEQIINDFKNGNDPKKVAKNLGFTDYLEMALYMKNKGYVWDDNDGNYVYFKEENNQSTGEKELSPRSDERKFLSLLELLATNEKQLRDLFDDVERQNSLPRYHISGHTITKTISISARLNDLVIEYAQERNLTHKEIFAISLVQFLRRYGYNSHVNSLFEK